MNTKETKSRPSVLSSHSRLEFTCWVPTSNHKRKAWTIQKTHVEISGTFSMQISGMNCLFNHRFEIWIPRAFNYIHLRLSRNSMFQISNLETSGVSGHMFSIVIFVTTLRLIACFIFSWCYFHSLSLMMRTYTSGWLRQLLDDTRARIIHILATQDAFHAVMELSNPIHLGMSQLCGDILSTRRACSLDREYGV